jgi:hypothetical protein
MWSFWQFAEFDRELQRKGNPRWVAFRHLGFGFGATD